MAAKQRKVYKWLGEIFGELEIPQFEKNEANINSLFLLIESYEESFKDLHDVSTYMETKSTDYERHGEQIADWLYMLNLSPNIFNSEAKQLFEALGNLSLDLNLNSLSSSNVILGINSIEEENAKVNEDLKREKLWTEKLLKLSQNAAHNLEELKSISVQAETVAKLQGEERRNEIDKIAFNQEKIKSYKSELEHLEAKLKYVDFDSEISHTSLSKKLTKFEELKKEVDEKKATLDSYTLPPDLHLAQVKVEEAKQKLSLAMRQITDTYNNQQ